MNGPILIIVALLALLCLFMVAGFIETRDERRPPAAVVQPPRKVVPMLPPTRSGGPWHPEFALTRGRRVRAARARARSVRLGRPRPSAGDASATARHPGA